MDTLIELTNNLTLDELIFDESFMELIYQMKQTHLYNNDIYDGDSIKTPLILDDKLVEYEDGIQ